MKLNEAYLCVDCEELLIIPDYDKDMNMAHCSKCSSRRVIPLEQWLYRNRLPDEPKATIKPPIVTTQTPAVKYSSCSVSYNPNKKCSECE